MRAGGIQRALAENDSNPVDQRSEFCRPETAKSVDQRSNFRNSRISLGNFHNFTRIPVHKGDAPLADFNACKFCWNGIPPRRSLVYRFRGLWSAEFRSLVYRIHVILRECSRTAVVSLSTLLNLVLELI